MWLCAIQNVGAKLNLRSEMHSTECREEVRPLLFLVCVYSEDLWMRGSWFGLVRGTCALADARIQDRVSPKSL